MSYIRALWHKCDVDGLVWTGMGVLVMIWLVCKIFEFHNPLGSLTWQKFLILWVVVFLVFVVVDYICKLKERIKKDKEEGYAVISFKQFIILYENDVKNLWIPLPLRLRYRDKIVGLETKFDYFKYDAWLLAYNADRKRAKKRVDKETKTSQQLLNQSKLVKMIQEDLNKQQKEMAEQLADEKLNIQKIQFAKVMETLEDVSE